MRPIDGDYISDALEAELCREGDDLEDRQWAYGYAAGVSFAVRKLAEAPHPHPAERVGERGGEVTNGRAAGFGIRRLCRHHDGIYYHIVLFLL